MNSLLMFEKRLESFKYNSDKQQLTLLFKNGSSRSYKDVPQKVYDELVKARNQNAFYKNNIDGHFALAT